MKKIETTKAPKALGPYSQAVKISHRSLVFISGQLPLDPKTGKLVEGDMKVLTKQVFKNLAAILEESQSGFEKVLRCDVFMTDLKQFQTMNEEYSKYFNAACPPARQTIQVAALPLGASIEISCIAVAD
ncbi:Protein DfrA [Chlamydiales bacterium STE3]|nr:Protein DfrA [Chlamydiales bacterium STE3]